MQKPYLCIIMHAYLYLKALHLASLVAWFGGMFYLVRLYVYHVEAFQKPAPERQILHQAYKVMERRLSLFIVTPAMVFTLVFGMWLMFLVKGWLQPWFHLKTAFLGWAFHLPWCDIETAPTACRRKGGIYLGAIPCPK